MKFLDADMNGRKGLLNQQLQTLGIFRYIVTMLKEAKDQRLPEEIIQEELAIRLPTEDVIAMTQTIISWGRFAELLGIRLILKKYTSINRWRSRVERSLPESRPAHQYGGSNRRKPCRSTITRKIMFRTMHAGPE